MNNERFFSMLQSTSAQKYLRANPFTKTDGVDFNGVITQDMFFEKFYATSSNAENLLQDIIREVVDNPESTIILQGYSGCGKTTFLHYLLYKSFPNSSVVDFEIGIDNTQEDPVRQKIQYIICENVTDDIINSKASTLKLFDTLFCKNYLNNHAITKYLDKNFKIRTTIGRLIILLDRISEYFFSDDDNKVSIMEAVDTCLTSLDVMQILSIYVLWDIANNVKLKKNIGNLFCFDNLDNIDIDKAKLFVKYFSQFWVNLINTFSSLSILDKKDLRLVERYGFILSLRETTYAKLTEHFNDNTSKAVLREFSLNEIYSQKNIITKRKQFLDDNKEFLSNCDALHKEVAAIESLMRNEYIFRNIFPLFNNSYNMAIKTICTISHKNPSYILEYNRIIDLKNKKYYRGANAIILKMFFDYFKEEKFFSDSLQLYDFSREDDQKYLFSQTRLILTYLSNIRSACSLYKLLREFEGIIDADDIVDILDKLYSLRYSTWRHLITFDKFPPIDQTGLQRQLDLYNQGFPEDDSRYCTFEITNAGRIYLKTMASHFEFYSTRLSRGKSKPLFAEENKDIVPGTDEYRFQIIINRVYQAVLKCCDRLQKADEAICEVKRWSIDRFYASDFVFRDPERRTKQFHGERLIFSHIGYINIYRQYLLSFSVSLEQKIIWNKLLVTHINNYLQIYENKSFTKSPVNILAAQTLRKQIDLIIGSDYEDFTTLIEAEYYNN